MGYHGFACREDISQRVLRRDAGLRRIGAGGRTAAKYVHGLAGGFLRNGSEGPESRRPGGAREGLGCFGRVSLPSRLRRVFFQARSGKLLFLVLILRAVDKEGARLPCQ